MRRTIAATALLALAGLSACGPSDQETRNEMRQGLANSCLAESGVRRAPPGFDWDRFCGCVTDGVMNGRSTSELKQGPPPAAARQAVVRRCMADMGFGQNKAAR